MKSIKAFGLAAMVALAALVACEKEQDPGQDPGKDPGKTPDTLVLKANIAVTAAGETQTISFTTSAAWTLESSASWVSLDKTSGEAGDVSVVVTVAANDTFENRTATITLTAGENKSTWTVSQGYVTVFGADSDIVVSADAQTIAITVTSNEDYTAEADCDWIRVVKGTKAAPVESAVTLNIAANPSIEARQGVVTLTSASGSVNSYVVKQGPSETAMVPVSVKYISNAQNVYDGSAYGEEAQYVLDFATANGTVTIVISTEPSEDPLAVVPAGEYEVDGAFDFAPGTFSIDGGLKYKTCFTVGDEVVAVEDGLIEIEEEDGVYTVVAGLMDSHENIVTYTFVGELPEIEDSSDMMAVEVSFCGDFNTHFATKAQKYNITATFSRSTSVEDIWFRYLSQEIYADASSTIAELPVGRYVVTTEDPDMDESTSYANGRYNYQPGVLYGGSYDGYFYSYEDESGDHSCLTAEGYVDITKNDDGTYNFEYDLVMLELDVIYDDDWNYVRTDTLTNIAFVKKYTDVVVGPLGDKTGVVVEDGDATIGAPALSNQYVSYYYGKPYSNITSTAFWFGFDQCGNNYMVTFPVVTAEDCTWEYVVNFNGRFCNTPIPAGTYTYEPGYTPVPMSIGNWKLAGRKCYVKNAYTGTISYATAGTLTLTDTSVAFELDTKTTSGDVYKFNGSFAASCYYHQNYTTSASRQAQAAWAVAPAE